MAITARFYINIEDASGNVLGPGPITDALYFETTARMDRAGSFSFAIPATIELAAYVQNERIARGFARLNNTWVDMGGGPISSIERSRDAEGKVQLIVSGDDLLREHSYRTVLDLKLAEGDGEYITHADAVALVAATLPVGWTVTADPSPPSDLVYGRFNGESTLYAWTLIADRSKTHFYKGAGRSLIFSSDFTSSGLRAIQAGPGDLAAETCAIVSLVQRIETYDLVTRVYPRGSGNGDIQLTLRATTRSAPAGYTLDTTNNYIENSVATAAYGLRERTVEYRDIGPISNSTLDVINAANTLFDVAIGDLEESSDDIFSAIYDLEVAECSALLRPMQTIRVVCRDDDAGFDLNDDLNILEATWRIDEAELRTTGLVVSTADRWPQSDTALLGDAVAQGHIYQALPQLNANSYCTSYTKQVDNDEVALFRFRFGPEVVQLQQVTFEFQIEEFLSTIRSVSGQTTTSTAGGATTGSSTAGGGTTASSTAGGGTTATSSTLPASTPTSSTLPASTPTSSTVPASTPTSSSGGGDIVSSSAGGATVVGSSGGGATETTSSTLAASSPTSSTVASSTPTSGSGGGTTVSSSAGGSSTPTASAGGSTEVSSTDAGDTIATSSTVASSTPTSGSGGGTTVSAASSGDDVVTSSGGGGATVATLSGGSAEPTTSSGGDTAVSALSGGSSVPTVASGGDTTVSALAGGSSVPTVASGGDTTVSALAGGSSVPTVASGGSSTPTAAGGGSSTPTTDSVEVFGISDTGAYQAGSLPNTEVGEKAGGASFSSTSTVLGAPGVYSDAHQHALDNHFHEQNYQQHTHNFLPQTHAHTVSIAAHTHTVSIAAHTHTVSIAAHTHTVNIASHTHTVSIAAHTHSVTIDAHTHTVSIAAHTHSVPIEPHTHTVTIGNHTHSVPLSSHTHTVSIAAHTHAVTPAAHTHTVTIAAHTHTVAVGAHSHTVAIGTHVHTVSIAAHTHAVTPAAHTHTVSIAAHSHTVTVAAHSHIITLDNHTHSVTISNHAHDVTIAAHTHTVSIAAHTHTVSIAAHTHTVSIAAHTHTVTIGDHTHSTTLGNHTHTVTTNDHTHTITPEISTVYGIFRESVQNTFEIGELEYQVNGSGWSNLETDSTDAGGGWYALDITTLVQDNITFRPLQTSNQLAIRATSATVQNLVSYSVTSPTAVVLNFASPHGLIVGQVIEIGGASAGSPGGSNINGSATVTSINTTTQLVVSPTGFAVAGDTGTGGTAERFLTATIDAQLSVRNVIQAVVYSLNAL